MVKLEVVPIGVGLTLKFMENAWPFARSTGPVPKRPTLINPAVAVLLKINQPLTPVPKVTLSTFNRLESYVTLTCMDDMAVAVANTEIEKVSFADFDTLAGLSAIDAA